MEDGGRGTSGGEEDRHREGALVVLEDAALAAGVVVVEGDRLAGARVEQVVVVVAAVGAPLAGAGVVAEPDHRIVDADAEVDPLLPLVVAASVRLVVVELRVPHVPGPADLDLAGGLQEVDDARLA